MIMAEEDDSISRLQEELHGLYLAAEKLMSLRHTDLPHLEAVVSKIETKYYELLEAIEGQETPSVSNMKESLSRNKDEFDTHYRAFLLKRADKAGTSRPYDCPSERTKSTHSSSRSSVTHSSSRSSVRLREAEVKFQVAQLKASHATEKREEEAVLLQLQQRKEADLLQLQQRIDCRNAERDIDIAAAELNIWKQATQNSDFATFDYDITTSNGNVNTSTYDRNLTMFEYNVTSSNVTHADCKVTSVTSSNVTHADCKVTSVTSSNVI